MCIQTGEVQGTMSIPPQQLAVGGPQQETTGVAGLLPEAVLSLYLMGSYV